MVIHYDISDSRIQELYALLHISEMQTLDLESATLVFVNSITFFKNGTISTEELSFLGSTMFHGVAKKYPTSLLFQATLSASELRFAVRKPAVYANIQRYLRDVDNFFDKEKK